MSVYTREVAEIVKELIIIGFVLIIAGWLGERFLKKKLNITKKTNTMDNRAKRLQFFAMGILVIGFIAATMNLVSEDDGFNMFYIKMSYFIAVTVVRGFFDWKFNQPSKQWVLQIYTVLSNTPRRIFVQIMNCTCAINSSQNL